MDDELDEGAAPGTGTEAGPSLQEQALASIGLGDDGGSDDDTGGAPDAGAAGTADAGQAADGQALPAAGTEGAPAAAAAAATPPADPAKQPANELYAPLPEHNPRKTHERFQKLIEGHKELDAKVKELEPLATQARELQAKVQEHEQGWQVFQEMGFRGEEAVQDLQQFAHYRNALSSGNWDAAAAVIAEQVRQLTLLSGRQINVNALSGFPDLNERVQAGAIDEQTALELARGRHQQAQQQQFAQRQQQTHQHSQQQAQAIQQGAAQVDQVVQQLVRDPDYAKVEPELVKHLEYIKANYLPHQWAGEIKRTYETEKRILQLAARGQTTAPAPQPLRGNGHGGGNPAPTTMAEAALQVVGLG